MIRSLPLTRVGRVHLRIPEFFLNLPPVLDGLTFEGEADGPRRFSLLQRLRRIGFLVH
jgi:hypothetical protein